LYFNDRKIKQKKKLGQHFLVDKKTVDDIIELSNIRREDIVYEVGSGNGILTNELCKISKCVYSFEIDPFYYSICKNHLCHNNLNLINCDGFNNDITVNFDVFFSSLPYYESRHAFSWLCQKSFKRGILLLQKEFVEKLFTTPGNKNYRAISVLAQYRFTINTLLDVPISSFYPQPKVNSVLIEIIPKIFPLSKKTIDNIQFLFSFRKKNVSFLINYFNKSGVYNYKNLDIDKIKNKKIGQLSVDEISELTCFLNEFNN
jgi:16S rRNA (adenine1518-N6/adenine1519-N6)-dimethyltransferase